MKKLMGVLLLCIVTQVFASEWVEVDKSDGATKYIHVPTITKSGQKAKVWELLDFNETQILDPGSLRYRSRKDLAVYDCTNRTISLLSVSIYSKNMGEGEALGFHSYKSPKLHDISPDSIFEVVLKRVCR